MGSRLFETKFDLEYFFVPDLELPQEFWLKENEILIKQHGEKTMVFILSEYEGPKFEEDEKILPYLRLCSLVTTYTPKIKGGGGNTINSMEEFGKNSNYLTVNFASRGYNDEQKKIMQEYYPEFLTSTKNIYEKYNKIVVKFEFMQLALDYFYKAQLNSVYNSEGFISAAISMEALFNEPLQT